MALDTLYKNQVSIAVLAYLWVPYDVHLLYTSIFMSVLRYPCHYKSVVEFEVR